GGGGLLDRDLGGAMRHDVAEMVAAIELHRHRRLMPDGDRTAAIAGARDPLGDADGARQPAVAQAAQFAIDQMVGNQPAIISIVSERGHDAHRQLTRFAYPELHDHSVEVVPPFLWGIARPGMASRSE